MYSFVSYSISTTFFNSGKMESHLVFDLETKDYKNPLHLEIDVYPNYIEGNVKIELKNPIK
jgi:hypothetical protein